MAMPLLRSFQAGNSRSRQDRGSATTSFEVEGFLCRLPKVAQKQQPWALIHNLVRGFQSARGACCTERNGSKFKVIQMRNAKRHAIGKAALARALQKLAHSWLGLLQSAVVFKFQIFRSATGCGAPVAVLRLVCDTTALRGKRGCHPIGT